MNHIKASFTPFFFFLIILSFSGCASHNYRKSLGLPENSEGKEILLMPMDIRLSTITTSGLVKPEAKWSQDANKYVKNAIRNKMLKAGYTLLTSEDVKGVNLSEEEIQKQVEIIKLHDAVSFSILGTLYEKLPNKKGEAGFSIGPEARFFKDKYGADYGLFVKLRDSYTTPGRALLAAAVVATIYVPLVSLGHQDCYMSLVDLNTGKIIWFNRESRGTGDLRTQGEAESSINKIMEDL